MRYQKLFDYLYESYGITLLESEMQDVIRIVEEIQNTDCIGECTCPEYARMHMVEEPDQCEICGKLYE